MNTSRYITNRVLKTFALFHRFKTSSLYTFHHARNTSQVLIVTDI